jgi:S-adenosylmethionine decarboxylase
VVGIDISKPTIERARDEFRGAPLCVAGADVRALPFQDGSFDAIYSMGTIEHFAETEQAVGELLRVLKPGGRAIVGVPNRHDPFLRPLMVAVLYRLGLYGYGFEKSYSRAALRKMLTSAGFVVVGDDGVLFIPGWLRMLDLLLHTRVPRLACVTRVAVRVFSWLEHNVPAVRRHGYLVAAIVERPHPTTQSRRYSAMGREWLVDAFGCQPRALRSRQVLQSIFVAIVSKLGLKTVGLPMWHTFEGEAGITGLQGLCESHLACHTYPEEGYAAFSLYCCRPDIEEWPWRERLAEALGATEVTVRVARRGPSFGTEQDPRGEPTDVQGAAVKSSRAP